MGKDQVKVRYDQEGDILYIFARGGRVKDTLEVGEDFFVEVDEVGKIIGFEVWRERTNIFSELLKYMDSLKEERVGI
ncbi:MAG: DUF2283 domain-containing protein [Candidatus Kuenenia sp.]|nr:DUF2283 domain-containing protein [Candidatus Kuenenia sp.]